MDREDQRRYFVVGSVILEVVTPLFQQKIENEYKTGGFGSFPAFMNSQPVIHTLFHLRHRNSLCCKDKAKCRNHAALPLVYCQWKKMFSENPGPGIHNCHCKFTANPVQLNELDISLSSLILLNCCNLSQPEAEAVQLLRQYKNDYLSHNTTGCITQTEYNTLWSDLVTCVLRLDPSKYDSLIKIEHRPLDKSLCKKYFTFLLDLHQQIEEIKSTMENVHSSIQAVSSSITGLHSSVEAAVQGMDTTVIEMNTTVQGMGNSIQGIETSVQQTNDLLKELLQKGWTCECGRQIIIPIFKDQPRKHRKQYQIGQNIFYIRQKLFLQSLFNYEDLRWIPDVNMMDDGTLMFCLPFEYRILICNTDGSQTDNIYVEGEPWCVTAVNNSTVAVLVNTLYIYIIPCIEIYDITNKHKLNCILIPGLEIHGGISMMNNKLVVSCGCRLLIVDHKTGETEQTIETDCIPNRIHTSGDRIFFCNLSITNQTMTIKMYSFSDNKVYIRTLPSSPSRITSLQDGSLYVLCDNGSIHHVSYDFKHRKKVKINNIEDLRGNSNVSYNTKQNKMVVYTAGNILSILHEKQ